MKVQIVSTVRGWAWQVDLPDGSKYEGVSKEWKLMFEAIRLLTMTSITLRPDEYSSSTR